MLRFASLGAAKHNTAAKRKQNCILRDPHSRFESDAVIQLLRFVLICYVLRYVFTFWEMLRFAALQAAIFHSSTSLLQ